MQTPQNLTRRLLLVLRGDHERYVRRSATGGANRDLRAAYAAHYADRGLLVVTLAWLDLRLNNWLAISARPVELYEPLVWLGKLIYPEVPSMAVWMSVFAVAAIATLVCLVKPRLWPARWVLAIALLLVIMPEFGYGHVQHVNHLFLLAHVYTIFRPTGSPRDAEEAASRAQGYRWFLLGLLAIYTVSGFWKVVDMTIRDVIKPGVTWLDPEGMLATSIAQMRAVDLPMTVPEYIESVAWAFPIGYVILTFLFCASFLGAFRRPLLVILIPTIALFHVLNAVALYALFLSTIIVAIVVLLPYDYFAPAIKKALVPVRLSRFEGGGLDALYSRTYENDDVDEFEGFYAYRELLRDRSVLVAAPLYYPGVAWACSQLGGIYRRRRRYRSRPSGKDRRVQ